MTDLFWFTDQQSAASENPLAFATTLVARRAASGWR